MMMMMMITIIVIIIIIIINFCLVLHFHFAADLMHDGIDTTCRPSLSDHACPIVLCGGGKFL